MITVATKNQGQSKALPGEVPALTLITPEDALLAQCAEIRRGYRQEEQQRAGFIALTASDEPFVSLVQDPMTHREGNGLGHNIFGGVILAQIYRAGRQSVLTHVGGEEKGPIVCVRQDRMDFLKPAYQGEILQSKAIITQSWHSSVEVQVECQAIANDGTVRSVARTYFVFVQLEASTQKPTSIKPIKPSTPLQQERQAGANQRRLYRQEEAKRFTFNL
jgi:acyl-CoA hydrolase